MLKKLPLLVLLAAACLWAADFWVAKPFTEWNDKEVQKIINDSPWSNKASIDLPGPGGGPPGGGGGGFGGGGGGRGGGRAPSGPQGDAANSDPGIDGGFGGGGGGGGGGGMSAPVVIRWQSALPIKQAMMKSRYGSEANTAPESKKILEREEQFYVIYFATSPMAARGLQARKDALMQATSLTVKGKPPIRPADIQFNAPPPGQTQAPVEMYILFPKTAPLAVEDKEVEFATKINTSNVKSKFKLKDMVINNKLEL